MVLKLKHKAAVYTLSRSGKSVGEAEPESAGDVRSSLK